MTGSYAFHRSTSTYPALLSLLVFIACLISPPALHAQDTATQSFGFDTEPALEDNSALVALVSMLVPMMENPRNPLLQISTSEGDLFLELFPDAAPNSVRRVLELAAERYYDGLVFHRTVPASFLQTGAVERAGRTRPAPIADEINARGLGLEQQPLIDSAGRPHPWMNIRDENDFRQRVLVPLYRNMNIRDSEQLAARQEQVLQRLRQMNLLQLHEISGYRYNSSLPSRRPLSGSVMLASYGPGTSDGELLLSLQDTPWLMGTHTVIGRIVSSLSLASSISRQPESSVRIYQIRQLDTALAPATSIPTTNFDTGV